MCLIYVYFCSILFPFSFLQTECLLLFDVWFLNKSVPPSYRLFICVFKIVSRVIVQASFCSFNLPLADVVNADLLKFNWQ